ncbi:hypothetical protein RFI_13476 [Reticulomyxa filosa]|uniref:Kelch motif family protein n=1 Tax=Reticulomyxa filosa TaxID=46433 RepID=X6ND50_RETFI|nr:hypothetical protein RFI_13476 [Reticulomyxa filosa]|eukprot:ETO23704.1 hypothetical protein RFI_13476 [Reticulomyxa filosa]
MNELINCTVCEEKLIKPTLMDKQDICTAFVCLDSENCFKKLIYDRKQIIAGQNITSQYSYIKININNIKMNTNITSPFETLTPLPASLSLSQCVTHKHEIIICGGASKGDCYSYHIKKNLYKRICQYPKDIRLNGHCVVKRVNKDDPNDVLLLSFGGAIKHTLMMKYVSVWNNIDEDKIQIAEQTHYNEWIPFTDKHNDLICIGRDQDDYWGVRAVIGGRNNHLLFITYRPNNIDIFNLDTLQFIKRDNLPTDATIRCHCFVSKIWDEAAIAKQIENKKMNEMILFCDKIGFSIKHNEDSNIFQFHKLHVCTTMRSFNRYAYIYVNDCILFFGGWNGRHNTEKIVLKDVHKYSTKEDKWTMFEHNLPVALCGSVAILSEDKTLVYVLGGNDGKNALSTNMRAKIENWTEETEKEKKWIKGEEEKKLLAELKKSLVT